MVDGNDWKLSGTVDRYCRPAALAREAQFEFDRFFKKRGHNAVSEM